MKWFGGWPRLGGAPPGRWMLAAWTVAVFLFLYLPIFVLIFFSFNDSKYTVEWKGFTLRWYAGLLNNRPLLDALWNSLIIALFTTVASVILGTLGAWVLYRYRFPFSTLIHALLFIPMAIPEVIMGVSLLVLFVASKSLFDWPDRGFLTVIIAHTTFCFPFVLVTVRARLDGVDPFLEEAAQDLGATPLQAFRLVMMPYLMPAIISSMLLAFTLSLDELIVTWFTTGPQSQTLPLKVYGLAKKGLSPELNALSALFILATFVMVVATEWIRKLNK